MAPAVISVPLTEDLSREFPAGDPFGPTRIPTNPSGPGAPNGAKGRARSRPPSARGTRTQQRPTGTSPVGRQKGRPTVALLSHQSPGSTIAEAGLNFRVRDGIGCGPRSMDGGSNRMRGEGGPRPPPARPSRIALVPRLIKRQRPAPGSPGGRVPPGEPESDGLVKPHDRLVPVSSTHCCASTPGLSTF